MNSEKTYTKKTWLILCLFFVFCHNPIKAENNIVDSLKTALNGTTGNERIDVLVKLTWHVYRQDTDKAEEYALEGLALSKENEYLKGEINCKINLGAIELYRGNFDQALKYNFESLKFWEQTKDTLEIGKSLNNIGLIYRQQKKYEDAIEYMNRSFDIRIKSGDSTGLANILNNIGSVYGMQNKFSMATQYFYESLHIEQQLNNQIGIAESYESLGVVFQLQGAHKKAISHFKSALITYKKKNDIIGLHRVLSNIGSNYFMTEEYDSTIFYCHKSLVISTEHGFKDMMKQSNLILASAYEAKGQFKEALKHHKSGLALSDSIFSEKMISTSNELQIAYETEKKERKISELELEKNMSDFKGKRKTTLLVVVSASFVVFIVFLLLFIRQRKIKAQKNKIELEQKALRAQMNPHFIFNSLNAIQEMYVGGEADLANDYMGDFGELMRKILDNSGKQFISIKEEMDTLRLYLEMEKLRSGELLEYEIKIDERIDQLNTFMSPLLIQPFVENAIWHGILPKKQKGKVSVALKMNKEKVICTIEDNGIGFEESKKNKKSIGHDSKGMSLTEQRLKHPIKIENLNPGTRITLAIPI